MSLDVFAFTSRFLWVLCWLFAVVCGVVVLGSLGLTGYSLYQRDTQLAQSGALLLGAAALGLLLAIAGLRVTGGT